jgi:hypothetical protein
MNNSQRIDPYALEKSRKAVSILLKEDDPLKDRLTSAWAIEMSLLDPQSLPSALKLQFLEMEAKVSTHEDEGNGSLDASIQALNLEEAQQLTEDMLMFLIALKVTDASTK